MLSFDPPLGSLGDGGVTPSTVVVVEDEPSIAAIVADILQEEGIWTTTCRYGEEVSACIRARAPKLVLLDIHIPGVDGIDLFHQLRADPATRAIAVSFFTADTFQLEERLPNYVALGATLLAKPFHVDALVDAVTRALGK